MPGGGLEESYPVNFIVNMLLRYPEIYTAGFDPVSASYNIAYLVTKDLKGESYRSFCALLKDKLEAFSYFKKGEVHRVSIRKENYGGLTRVEVLIKDKFLDYDEVSLLCRLMREQFNDRLLAENRCASEAGEEEAAGSMEERLMLFRNRKFNRLGQDTMGQLFAFRDSGKVYIYDK